MMSKDKFKKIILINAGWLLLPMMAFASQPHHFQNKNQQKQQLQQINQSIVSLKKNIFLSEAAKEKIEQQLETTESSIGSISQQLHQTNSHLNQVQLSFKQNLNKQQQLKLQLATQKQLLNQYIRSAYILSRQPYLKVLLNQENPTTMNRFLHYYHSILQAHWEIMQQIQQTIQNLQTVAAQIHSQSQQLSQLKIEQLNQTSNLQTQKSKRQIILKQINSSIVNKKQQLQKLIADKNRLQNLLQQVEKQTSQYTSTAGSMVTANAHGKLNWPINSRLLLQQFNQPLVDGRLHSTGILIKADPGTPIHAILPGKVAFAQWLRGYGLLIIIQHGNNFLTLYAHAESVNVHVGDIVKANDVIGTVGNSGGFEQNGLYFEIRRGSQPLNPMAWLKR